MEGFSDAPVVAAPVLPKGHPPLPKPPPLRTFTLASLLAETQSAANSKRLVAVKGAIFDVSADSRFESGGRWHDAVGKDLTRTLAFTSITGPAPSTDDTEAVAAALAAVSLSSTDDAIANESADAALCYTIESLQEGDIVDGTVTQIQPFGLMIKLDRSAISGLAHISQLADELIADLRSHYTIGQKLRAKVVKIDKDAKKVSLGLKELQPESEAESTPAASAASAANGTPVTAHLHLESSHQGARALEGLDFDALRTLETWWTFFQDHFEIVGRILTDYEAEAEANGSKWSRPGEAEMAPLPSDIYGSFLPLVENSSSSSGGANASSSESSLHTLLDADDRDRARQLIDSLPFGSPVLDRPCPRSAMSPLHKSVERDWLDVVEALLAKGADARLPCALYDGETAIDMARRFQSKDIVAALEAKRD